MTINTLEQYRGIVSEINAMTAEIETLYDTRKSPNGREPSGHGSTPSDPTERTALRIIDRKQVLEQKRIEMLALLDTIDAWIQTVDDAQVRALIRWYFINGLTWKATSVKVYGYPCPQRAYQRVRRFFKENASV